MCNGTGSVRTSFFRPRGTAGVPRHLYDVNKIPIVVNARLNKNEFRLFTTAIERHLHSYDFRRAAACFNYLMSLTQGTDQSSDKQIHKELQKIKREYLDDLIRADNAPHDISEIMSKLEERFNTLYEQYY